MVKHPICSAKYSWILDNFVRKFIHNPNKILKNFIKEGMTVLDVGCGPGLFSIEMANLVGETGKVIAADLQQDMLDKIKRKILGKNIKDRIILHKCNENKIGIKEKVDFVLAFYMVHEIFNKQNFFKEIYSIMKPDARLLFVEPIFHVSKLNFEKSIEIAKNHKFKPLKKVKVFFSRGIILKK